MEIIVNDTNIFIDLHSIGLLEALCELPYDIRTVDFVIAEITDPKQSEALSALAREGQIRIVCYYARKHAATLLTGDRQLRRYAEAGNVSVRGILFIFDELVANNAIPSQQAANKLRELIAINVRLPKSEIEKRINNWRK